MRTTLDLPAELLNEAMQLTNAKTKTDVIKTALKQLVQKEKTKGLQDYFGKVDITLDLDATRSRDSVFDAGTLSHDDITE